MSTHLGLPPTATYAAVGLWNFTYLPGSDLSVVENSRMLYTFTGTPDEEWFYQISIAIEAQGAQVIPVMLRAMDAVRTDDSRTVALCLVEFVNCLEQSSDTLLRMYERCSPDVFYHQIRPILAGSKNMASSGLPNGVFYEDYDGKGQWHQYSGGSNAQSTLIQFFDVVLGVEHRPTRNPKQLDVPSGKSNNYLKVYSNIIYNQRYI